MQKKADETGLCATERGGNYLNPFNQTSNEYSIRGRKRSESAFFSIKALEGNPRKKISTLKIHIYCYFSGLKSYPLNGD